MTEELECGDQVLTVKPKVEPKGYEFGARDDNRWGIVGVVIDISNSHGLCYRVMHDGTFGWYEPDEVRKVGPKNLWDHLKEGSSSGID